MANETKTCNTGRYARVASAFAHFGEEDCLRGWNGSGTIFFSLCNLRCVFCQNWDISQRSVGDECRPEQIAGPSRMNCAEHRWLPAMRGYGGSPNAGCGKVSSSQLPKMHPLCYWRRTRIGGHRSTRDLQCPPVVPTEVSRSQNRQVQVVGAAGRFRAVKTSPVVDRGRTRSALIDTGHALLCALAQLQHL